MIIIFSHNEKKKSFIITDNTVTCKNDTESTETDMTEQHSGTATLCSSDLFSEKYRLHKPIVL